MDDYIAREAVRQMLRDPLVRGLQFTEYELDKIPMADVEKVRHARWDMRGGKRYCTYCKERACVTRDTDDFWYTVGTDYCPSCGAKMEVSDG